MAITAETLLDEEALDAGDEDRRERFVFEFTYFSGLLSWANGAVAAVSDSIVFCDFAPEKVGSAAFFEKWSALRAKIWASLIVSVSLFPNYHAPGLATQSFESDFENTP